MISGWFADDHPRLSFSLPTRYGPSLSVEFILDTGFAGDLVLPSALLARLDATIAGSDRFALADGSFLDCSIYEMAPEWFDESRVIETLALEGEPLVGTRLLRDLLLSVEMTESGQVEISSL